MNGIEAKVKAGRPCSVVPSWGNVAYISDFGLVSKSENDRAPLATNLDTSSTTTQERLAYQYYINPHYPTSLTKPPRHNPPTSQEKRLPAMSDAVAAISKAKTAAVAKKPIKKIRPARKQVAVDQIDKSESVQTGKEYNIWYNKWAGGDREDSYGQYVHPPLPSTPPSVPDSLLVTATNSQSEILIVFPALPDVLPDTALDCFGREKHADYRDDMGGVGSFGRQNRTLYVGKMREGATKADTEEIVRRHFGEWGEIVKLNILHNRGVAFVTYANELQAQFAREAMANQSMDGDEILNVRWATEDPNPRSIVDERQRLEELGTAGITSKIDVHADLVEAVQAVKALEDGDVDDLYPIPDPTREREEDNDEPPSKRLRLEGGPSAASAGGGGLFGGDAMENIKYFADLARQQAQQQQQASNGKPTAATSKPNASALVGGYGSDSDAE
ncbi:hypothetical protein QFC21_006231 [Naganishia friedmannii]|uniref:Uncharacterized protein n=1 Tax=Naganishia friedmannii TaxID=89922 RepID=A0ACC2V417_9TREE|nr:hypothetical protein QFC21_006231 [Naganishia friedmannii]